jgi:hypothetical protein
MATKLAARPKPRKSSKARNLGSARPSREFTTLMGFKIESEPMPDNPAETLYTLTHPDLPGMVMGDSNPWSVLLCGLDAAGRMLRHQMESGEQLPVKSST